MKWNEHCGISAFQNVCKYWINKNVCKQFVQECVVFCSLLNDVNKF